MAIEVTSTPAIMGVVMRPAVSGLRPSTICRKVGRYDTVPIMPNMMNRPVRVQDQTKLRFLNSVMGTMGSAALRSTSTKATPHATERANRPRICQDTQG